VVHEYALEPELVATWSDLRDCRYFRENFGIGQGRLVSRFPKNWRKRVYEAIRERDDVTEMGSARLQALVDQLCEDMVKRSLGHFDHTRGGWLGNALREHEQRPFHAILARSNPAGHEDVVSGDDLAGHADRPLWSTRRTRAASRRAQDLAQVVAPLLRISSTIIFVDPYFTPSRREYRETLAAFLCQATTGRPVPLPARVEVLVKEDERKGTSDFFRNECVERLGPLISRDLRLEVRQLAEKWDGQELHNRYILTDLGGILFGHGLDEAKNKKGKGHDDLVLLTDDVYQHRWSQYSERPLTAFDEREQPIAVVGGA